MAREPAFSSAPRGSSPTYNTYQGRWRWWYSSIADWMIRNPGAKLDDCARELGKHPNTISMIVNTDIFREYLARRKEEFHRDHDFALRSRLTSVAEASLDLVLGQLHKKGDQLPMKSLESIATSALDRLGYAPDSKPVVVVDQSQHDNRQQIVSISGLTMSALEEAREALRLAEQKKAGTSLAPPLPSGLGLEGAGAGLDEGVSDVDSLSEEVERATIPDET